MSTFEHFLKNSSWSATSVQQICASSLAHNKIKGLVLDFDGVLSGADEVEIDEVFHQWFMNSPTNLLAIHSNNPPHIERLRKKHVAERYPEVLWLPTAPKKPNPTHILTICQKWGILPQECAMVDDRLLTGGKAAYFARAKFIYIVTPKAQYAKKPAKEVIYQGIRYGERWLYTPPVRKWCAREDSNL